jgi:hypothetical protein
MKNLTRITFACLFLLAASVSGLYGADFLGDILKKVEQLPAGGQGASGSLGSAGLDEGTIASGLKDALAVGTKNAVSLVSKTNGYFGNQAIKILLPDNIQRIMDLAGKVGYQKQVDNFIMSMNRAAEQAAPKAASFFAEAIKGMTLDDARKILTGGNTAATDYFKTKTSADLYEAFKPSVTATMNKVGVAKSYNALMGQLPSLPILTSESTDLNHYVTTKALDGLFYMIGQEEQKIRTNPLARTTDLLKKVFGK